MSSPYPPQAPKRLERSKSNRVLGGVCAGVANYLNMDPTLVRVLTVVISLFTGVPIILYNSSKLIDITSDIISKLNASAPAGGPAPSGAATPAAPAGR